MNKPELKTIEHCSEDAITAYLLGIAERKDCNHIDACLDCYARAERARIQLNELRAEADQFASRPEQFWARQRAVIMGRVTAPKPSFGYRWVWAAGGAVAMLALALVLILSPWKTQQPTRVIVENPDKDDDVLLTEIESDLQRPVPRALEPANLLVRARNEMASANRQHASGGIQE